MNVIERAQAPTPKFFRMLRNVGFVLAAVGGVLLAAPVGLPTAIVTLGGYIAVAGGVLTAVSQITVEAPEQAETGSTETVEDAE